MYFARPRLGPQGTIYAGSPKKAVPLAATLEAKHPARSSWRLPCLAWVALACGMVDLLGLVSYGSAMAGLDCLRDPTKPTQDIYPIAPEGLNRPGHICAAQRGASGKRYL